MTEVTNKMVAEACLAYQTKGTMRAAIEAALAMRKQPDNAEVQQISAEVKRLTAECDNLRHDIERHLNHISGYETERAELIEALRPFAEQYDSSDENHWITCGDCRRARALLERIGKTKEPDLINQEKDTNNSQFG